MISYLCVDRGRVPKKSNFWTHLKCAGKQYLDRGEKGRKAELPIKWQSLKVDATKW